MAVVAYVKPVISGLGEVVQYTWTLANGDTGAPLGIPNNFDATVHIYGTFGTGGSVTLYGTNNTTTFTNQTAPGSGDWIALTDPQGNAITKTAAAIEAVLEMPLYMGPACTAGDGTTSLTVNLLLRRKGLS